jgi:formylglycine-generating enzyme required for sulfatase activity
MGLAGIERNEARSGDMVWIPGGTFRMGSNDHYAEEAPVHRAAVDGFLIDRTPVTNRQFKEFVNATGHVTTAQIVPDLKDYPGALPSMLYAGSLVFSPPLRATDLRDWSQWWSFMKGANWRHPYGPKSSNKGSDDHPVVHVSFTDATIETAPFVVRMKLDDEEFAKRLPAGATGTAAIFTDHVKVSHLIRRVLLRQVAILNYVNLF